MPTFRITSPDGKTYDVTGPDGSTPEQALEQVKAQHAPAQTDARPELQQRLTNVAGGMLRGAGGIGSTLVELARSGRADAPFGTLLERVKARQSGVEGGTQSLGADPSSTAYGAGKLGTEIAGTMGVGGAMSGALKGVPMLADAVRTAGMSAGGATGLGGIGARMAGGALTGGAATALVSPEDAGTGAAIGGALPPLMMGAGRVGAALAGRGPAQSPDAVQAIQAARKSGYVIPPTQANPTMMNRMIEGFSGKLTTAQNASAANQGVTNKLAAESLGLSADTKLTPDVLNGVRKAAGQAYEAIGQSGVIRPGEKYAEALDRIVMPHLQASVGFPASNPSPVVSLIDSLRSEAFDASSAVAKIKELRSAADDAFRTGNTDIGRASKSAATALEDAIETHLADSGAQDLLTQFRDARKLIAKTYTVEKALNPATGSVDARNLAAQVKRGKPLSGELLSAAQFAARFPKAAQPIEGMGSLPQTSPLDWHALGAASMVSGNPLPMLGVLARPAARKAALSPLIQDRLIQGANRGSLLNDEVYQNLLRGAPLLGSGQ